MKRMWLLIVLLVFGFSTVAHARSKTDVALFNGADTTNLDLAERTGALCAVGEQNRNGNNFSYSVAVTNDSDVRLGFWVMYSDGTEMPYRIAPGLSFSLSQAGGSNTAVRIDAGAGTYGAVSAFGRDVFCISCDTLEGDAECDQIINTPDPQNTDVTPGTGPIVTNP